MPDCCCAAAAELPADPSPPLQVLPCWGCKPDAWYAAAALAAAEMAWAACCRWCCCLAADPWLG